MRKSGILGSIIFFIVTSVFLGCGGSTGGSNGGGSDGTAHRSITECYGCHADGLIAKYADEDIFSEWRDSSHGNYEGTNDTGTPSYDELTSSSCNSCHDDRGDGELLENYYATTGISFLGTVNRPLVGCESCHGSGETHNGIGLMQYPDPDASICGNCHKEDSYHAAGNPEGDGIYEKYQASPHASSINSHNYATGSTTDVKAKCSKCHTDEGAKLYKDVTGGYAALSAALPNSLPSVVNASVVQCRTCHNAHDADKLLKPAGIGTSSQYETCTNCHQTSDAYHGENSSHSWSGNAVGSGTLDTSQIMYDTHFDDDTTTDIEGYNIDKAGDRSCSGCHNPHSANTTINQEWANSSHGGYILQTTDPVTGRSSVTEAEGPAWVHYDFKAHPSRDACQRCHTATGFKNLVTDPSTYDPADNDFSSMTGEQRQMLYCWACHADNTGGLREPGAFANVAPYSAPADRINAVPDINGSNLCMSCHSGRLNGQFIKDYGTISGKNFGTFNSHYLADGGILFRTLGYEFSSLDYSDVIGFSHGNIGTTNGTDGNNGPCVGCHMLTDDDHPNHTWEALEKDGSGQVTDVTTYNKVCARCHSSKATLISTLNTRNEQYHAALDALEAQLQSKGIYFCESHPYFKTAASCGGANYDTWPNKDMLGAAFNYNLLKHIPNAYVHNREYTRKLIYDSIDFLDNSALDESVEATLGSGDAYDYLYGTR